MADTDAIHAELQKRLGRAHAPYSGVRVAAAIEGPDGRLHYGVNVENAAYPQGVCAEASAISAAVIEDATPFARIFLASSLSGHIWPCGGCRQKIHELAARGCEIVSLSPQGDAARQTIEALLPLAFRLDVSARG